MRCVWVVVMKLAEKAEVLNLIGELLIYATPHYTSLRYRLGGIGTDNCVELP